MYNFKQNLPAAAELCEIPSHCQLQVADTAEALAFTNSELLLSQAGIIRHE